MQCPYFPGLGVRTPREAHSLLLLCVFFTLFAWVLLCVSACLSQAGITADTHLVLSDHGVKKRTHADFDAVQAAEVYVRVVLPAVRKAACAPL